MLLEAWSRTAPTTSWWTDWIPLISAVLAFAGGIAGVMIGARLNARDQAQRWRAQQRNEALLSFAKQGDAYLRMLTRYVAPAVAGQTTANELLEAYYGLSAAGTLVQMMSPPPIRAAVQNLMQHIADNILPFTLPGNAPVPQGQALAITQGFVASLAVFVEAARADFGET